MDLTTSKVIAVAALAGVAVLALLSSLQDRMPCSDYRTPPLPQEADQSPGFMRRVCCVWVRARGRGAPLLDQKGGGAGL